MDFRKITTVFARRLVLTVAFLVATLVQAGDPIWPSLTSDVDKVRFLLWTQQHIPNLFQAAVQYNRNWFDLLDEQMRVLQKLATNPRYIELKKHDPALLRIDVLESAPTPLKKADFDESLWAVIRKDAALSESEAEKTVAETLEKLRHGNPSGLRIALIRSGPPGSQKDWFKNTDWASLRSELERELPEILPAQFRGAEFGLGAENIRTRDALELLDRLFETRRKLQLGLESWIVSRAGAGNVPSAEGAKKELGALVDGVLNREFVLLSPKEKQKLGYLAQEVGLERLAKALPEGEAIAAPVEKVKLRLVEVPAQLAIFRGCVGNDCSTLYSAAYGQSPMERVFLIQDAEGFNKGYLSATLVRTNGQQALYLHTIAGPRISEADTELIFHAFEQSKDKFAAQSILIPGSKDQVFALVNFETIRKAYYAEMAGKTPSAIQYYDGDVRTQVLDQFSQVAYDRMASNGAGVALSPKKSAPLNLRYSGSPIDKIDLPPIDAKKALLLALDHEFIDQHAIADRIIATAGIGKKDFMKLVDALYNDGKLPVAAHLENVAREFAAFGVVSDAAFVDEHLIFFQEGMLKAPDLLEAANTPTAKDFLKWTMARTEMPTEDAKKALRAFMGKHQDHFLALNPSASEKTRYLKWNSFADWTQKKKILGSLLDGIRTPEEFAQIAGTLSESLGSGSVENVVLPFLRKRPFLGTGDRASATARGALAEALAAWRKTLATENGAKAWAEVYRYQLELQTDPVEFLKVLEGFEWGKAPSLWTKELKPYWSDLFLRFMDLEPTLAQVKAARGVFSDALLNIGAEEADRVVRKMFVFEMKSATKLSDLISITDRNWDKAAAGPYWDAWQKGFADAVDDELFARMRALGAGAEDWAKLERNFAKLRGKAVRIPVWGRYHRFAVRSAEISGPAAMLDAMKLAFNSSHEKYVAEAMKYGAEEFSAFAAVTPPPTVQQWRVFLERSVLDEATYAAALKKALAAAPDAAARRTILGHSLTSGFGFQMQPLDTLRQREVAKAFEASFTDGSAWKSVLDWVKIESHSTVRQDMLGKALARARTTAEFIETAEFGVSLTAGKWTPAKDAFAKFAAFRPSIDEVRRLKRVYLASGIAAAEARHGFMRAVETGMAFARTSADYVALFDFERETPLSAELLEDLRIFHAANRDRFKAANPTKAEVRLVESRFGGKLGRACQRMLMTFGW